MESTSGKHPVPRLLPLVCGKGNGTAGVQGQLGYGEVNKDYFCCFRSSWRAADLPAVASSLDGATRLYALLLFVLICAVVALFASLSPSRRRAREIRRQVLQQQQQQQNQAMNQQVPLTGHPISKSTGAR